MIKRIRAARHYQRPDDPVLRLSRSAMRSIARELKHAFTNLKSMVDVDKTREDLRHARNPAASINWHHYREVLRGAFDRLGKLRHAGGSLGARKINGSFAAKGRKVRFTKAYNENEPRDDRGRWAGGGEQQPRHIPFGNFDQGTGRMAFNQLDAQATRMYSNNRSAGPSAPTYGAAFTMLPDGSKLQANANYRGANTRGSRRGSGSTVTWVHNGTGITRSAALDLLRTHIGKVEKATGDQFNFDSFTPEIQRKIRQAQDDLIVGLETDARDTIERIIADGTINGTPLDDVAENIRDMISLTDTQASAVLNYKRMLEEVDPQALTRQLRNEDFDAVFQDALQQGVDLSDAAINSMVDDYIDNYLDYRAAAIAQTESTRAANEGLHDAYSQAIDRGALPEEAVTRQWQLGDAPCPVCESIPDNNPDGVGIDDPFDSDDGPIDDPPVHPHCECSVEYVTDLTMLEDDSEDDSGSYDTNVPIEG